MSRKVETVVFDLGGVLVDWNPRYLYRQLLEDEAEIERFLTEVCDMNWNLEHDAGRPFEDGIRELSSRHPQHEPLIRAYFERWPEMLGGAIQGSVEILETIHREKRHRLFALSNWSAETYPHAKKRFPFLGHFEKVLLSGEEKMIKPDPRFFQLLTTRHHVRPESTLFIDDVEKNVAAARELGFQTIRFTNAEELRAELLALGIIT